MANLILYSKSEGIGQILRPRLPSGELEMIRSESDWRTSWDKIVWIDSQFDGHQANGHLLFYDSGAGIGELYRYRPHTDVMTFATRRTDWRSGWNEVVSARLGNLREDPHLIFYQRAGGGEGEVYTFSTGGRMNLVIRDKAWRDSWAKVVAGRFTLRSDIRSAGYDLLFYDQSHGDGSSGA